MTKRKRLFSILFALPPLLFGLLYGGGYIAQFMRNYNEWQSSGGTPGGGTSPTMPSFDIGSCLGAIFTMPYGIIGILICVYGTDPDRISSSMDPQLRKTWTNHV